MALLTLRRIRRYIKPPVFVASSLPLLWLIAGMFGLAGVWLGANPVTTIQNTTGIWAVRFLMLTLLCTPLRWVTGQAWPIHFRRMMGLYAFTYATLHFLNYLLLDRALDMAEIATDIFTRFNITIGVAALVLMMPLALTSTAGWRRRLGARWQTLHRVVYAIAILGCWHFYWQVKRDVREPLLYCAILSSLLGYRLWRARFARMQATASAAAG